jgi:excinuclease ABC subunit A
LRLLFARVGHPHCPKCGREITVQTVQQIVDSIQNIQANTKIMILAPLVKGRKGEYQSVFADLRKSGYARVRVDKQIYELSDEIQPEKNKKHDIEVIVDRIVTGQSGSQSRVADSVETALKLGNGVVLVTIAGGEELLFSEHFACVICGISLGEIAPRTFSFNSPHGACPQCSGLGIKLEIDPDMVIDKDLSINEGAIRPWQFQSWYLYALESMANRHKFTLNTPVKDLNEEQYNVLLYGENGEVHRYRNRFGRVREHREGFEGVIPRMERLYRDTESENSKADIERYMVAKPCSVCEGNRLKPEALSVTIGGKNIMQVTDMPVVEALKWITELNDSEKPILSERERMIAPQVLKELHARLGFLRDVGLDYLSLGRAAATLSGGEAQRIRLATQIGSGLMGVLYICDEPTIGLHPADDSRLIETLKSLRNLGNTILVVEHDEAMMRAADHIIDMGPGAGEHGGFVVAAGTMEEILKSDKSITGQYLSGVKRIAVPLERRTGNGKEIVIKGARQNNLKNIDVHIPLGKFICITGVSGSGKSTLVDDILYRKLSQIFYRAKERAGECDAILGIENVDKVINVDQTPIGRTPRSNPATYTGTFGPIRELFAAVPEARTRGYGPGRFSFNVIGGRCEACRGEGFIEIEMQFLPNVTVPCEVCKGSRYNREALEVKFKDKNIAEVLDMTVEQALEFFENFPGIRRKLETIRDVGLGYIHLGQPAPTLSGGEAQRVKLATELSRRSTGKTLYILDEPTTGLSFEDVAVLLKVLQRLADGGNTVIVIEHNLDVMKNADYIIDLGPDAGDRGGYIIAAGAPEDIVLCAESVTGQYLKNSLNNHTS